jgi:hypothetical protein
LIVRSALKCDTCGQPHTVRIGMGQETTQRHAFGCTNCHEQISVRLEVDYENLSARVVCENNATEIAEVVGAPIVNIDANFAIAPTEQGVDSTFPRLRHMDAMLEKAKASGSLLLVDPATTPKTYRPYRRPDYAYEWRLLKKAWSLASNNRSDLANAQVQRASAEFYADDPLKDFADWVWRFALFFCNPAYELKFRSLMETVRPLWKEPRTDEFAKFYSNLIPERAEKYFGVIDEFFSGYDEFSQVYLSVVRDLPIDPVSRTTSTNFAAVRMFYGNGFEAFTSLVEFLALLNNLLNGRAYDAFASLTLDQYRKLDKASRFNAFAMNAQFMDICREADNQLRNASHHGGLRFSPDAQLVKYSSGKGGTGSTVDLPYVVFLERSVHLFLQLMTLLRAELIFANQFHLRWAP